MTCRQREGTHRVGGQLQGVEGAARVQLVQAVDAGGGARRPVGLGAAHEDDLQHADA